MILHGCTGWSRGRARRPAFAFWGTSGLPGRPFIVRPSPSREGEACPPALWRGTGKGGVWATGLFAALLFVLGSAGGAVPAEPPAPSPVDERETVLAAVRAQVAGFRATPSEWFRVEFRRQIRLLRGAKVFAVTRLTIPETHGLVGLASHGHAYLLGSDWTGPCAATGFNALVDPAQVKLETPRGAAAFARAYLALMHLGRARLVERLADIPDPDTDEYREYERDVVKEIEEKYRGLVRPVLREERPGGSVVSFYVWIKSELQRWELGVTGAGQVTACTFLRVAGTPADRVP